MVDKTISEDTNEIEEINDNETTDDGLPLYVKLNPIFGPMWRDDLSGLYMSSMDATDPDGNPLKDYGRVPNKTDCSRIADALRRNILVPCDPSGRSRKVKPRQLIQAESMEKFMNMKQLALVSMIEQIRDVDMLSKMRQFEEKSKNKRLVVLQALVDRMKSRDVVGVTDVKATQEFVYNKTTGRMEKDVSSSGKNIGIPFKASKR